MNQTGLTSFLTEETNLKKTKKNVFLTDYEKSI